LKIISVKKYSLKIINVLNLLISRRLNSPDLIEHQKGTETTSELPDVPLILPATKEKSSKFEF
jgi:hypothetical protein